MSSVTTSETPQKQTWKARVIRQEIHTFEGFIHVEAVTEEEGRALADARVEADDLAESPVGQEIKYSHFVRESIESEVHSLTPVKELPAAE